MPLNQATKEGRGQTRGLDAETRAGEHWRYPVGLTHKRQHRGCRWPGEDCHKRQLQWLLLLEQHVADSREGQARAWMWVIDRQFRIQQGQVVALEQACQTRGPP